MSFKDFLFQSVRVYEYGGQEMTADEVLAAMESQARANGGAIRLRVDGDDSAQPHDSYGDDGAFSSDTSQESLVEYDSSQSGSKRKGWRWW